MKIVFISHYKWPHRGGVEKHLKNLNEELRIKNYEITIISEEDIKYPHRKFIGLFYIWFWLFKHRKLIIKADIVHIHDVFIWYLPFRFLFPKKKVFLTIHGLEWNNPFNYFSLLQKRIAVKLCKGSTGIGKFLEKYINCKFDYIIYGGLNEINNEKIKIKNSILFVGRLEPDTGLLEFIKYLKNDNLKAEFVGDGSLRKQCEKFGIVHGFCNAEPFYKKAETVIPSGYLTYLEAKSYGCKIKTFYSTQLKKEYWQEIKDLKKFDTWEAVANRYVKLWKKSL